MVAPTRWQLIGLVAFALTSCSDSPDWDRLEAQGNEIVRAVEAYHSARGEYPSSLDAAGAHPSKTRWGIGHIIAAAKSSIYLSEITATMDFSYTTVLMSVGHAAPELKANHLTNR